MIFRKTNRRPASRLRDGPAKQHNAAPCLWPHHLEFFKCLAVSFSAGGRETALICLSGSAFTKTGGCEFELGQYDAIYIPTRFRD